jgi:hypothetical protein
MVSVTPRLRFTPRERAPVTHWIGSCLGLRGGLDTEVRGKILLLLPGIDRPVIQSTVRHYTELPRLLIFLSTST